MPSSPQVGLYYTDQGFDQKAVSAAAGELADVITQQVLTYRQLVIREVRRQLAKKPEILLNDFLQVLDGVSRLTMRQMGVLVRPSVITHYLLAFQRAKTIKPSDIPMPVINAMAEQYVQRMGEYFHETSREAMAQGFNTMVNQRIPQRVAANRVLEAYGLTPRQMSGFTSLRSTEKVSSAQPMSVQARVRQYIYTSVRQRLKLFATQEEYNLSTMAQQTAWTWMEQNGRLDPRAEKVWITAKDERVCPQCGPMHGRRVGVSETFEMPDKTRLYVPGAHVNCRCQVNMVEPRSRLRLVPVRKDLTGAELAEFNANVKRDAQGRFSETAVADAPSADAPSAFLESSIAAAEKLRSQPTIDLSGHVREPEPTINLRSSSLDLSTPTLDLSTPTLDLSTPTGQAISITGRTPGLTVGGASFTVQGQTIHVTEKVALHLNQVATQVKQAMKTSAPVKMSKPQTYTLERPVWGILDRETSDERGNFRAEQVRRWTTDEGEMVSAVLDEQKTLIVQLLRRAQDRSGALEMATPDGEVWYGSLDDETAGRFIEAMVSASNDPDFHWDDIKAPITWINSEWGSSHQRIASDITYAELSDMLDITPDDFEVRMVRVTRGHDSKLGVTALESVKTKHGYEDWYLSGDFHLTSGVPGDIYPDDLMLSSDDDNLITNLKVTYYEADPTTD